jgi:hypothetical protein
MEQKTPPSKKCEQCYYWRALSVSGDFNWYACHYCYETGKPRDRSGDKCRSFIGKDKVEHVWRRSYAKKQTEQQ